MGEAIIRGLLDAGWPTDQINAADTDRSKLDTLAGALGISTSQDAAEAVVGREVVVVVVKPNHVPAVIERLDGVVLASQVIVSVAAGVPTTTYERRLQDIPVVRAMPNTPALLGAGVAGIAAGTHADRTHMRAASAVLGAVGVVVEVEESLLDAVTAVSGSGPAYVFLLAEAMQRAALELGLEADIAETLVNHTIHGAGRMLTETGTDAATLRERVTSPNGTTAAALDVFDEKGFASIVAEAIRAARLRSQELGRET
jgi:pyrroline-5-carboxylate reductase